MQLSFFLGVGRVEISFVYLALSFAVSGLGFFFVLLACYMSLPLNARKSQVKELSAVLYAGCELVLLDPRS